MPDLSLIHCTVPARHGSAPHPALILLHGLGANELDLLSFAHVMDPQVFAISARAPYSYYTGYMWYDLDRDGPGLGSESIERSLKLLHRFLGGAMEAYPIDPTRVFLGGFSMGAAMAGAMALLEPERVAGVIMASGYLPPDAGGRYRGQDAADHPIFMGHGTLDPVVPVQYARMTRDYLRGTPVELTYREYEIGHEVSVEELTHMASWLSAALARNRPSIQATRE
jgi:phospholipase/carboxylesterase